MKAIKSISALLLLSMLAVGVTSCSDGGSGDDNKNSTNASSGTNQSGDNSGSTEGKKDNAGKNTSGTNKDGKNSGESTSATTPKVTLPESVGENPFAGKTFSEIITGGDAERKTRTWNFTDSKASEVENDSRWNGISTSVYRYSYDANQKLLFLALESSSGKDDKGESSYSSVAEYEVLLKKMVAEKGKTLSNEALEIELAKCANEFATMVVYQYEISDSSISFSDYFAGTLPTIVNFWGDKITLRKKEGIWLWPEGSTGNGDGYHCEAPVYSDGTFTGKLSYNNEIIGSVEGTYTTSGKGIKGSGCTITLIFTKLPDSVTGFTTGTEYVLKN